MPSIKENKTTEVFPDKDRKALYKKYESKIHVNQKLKRTLVSFQENKKTPFYGWFKYKEGFAANLVHYLLDELKCTEGTLLDPFAGAGAALFVANERNFSGIGIEVLPVGIFSMEARKALEKIDKTKLVKTISKLYSIDYSKYYDDKKDFPDIAITNGAFPTETKKELLGYINYCNKHVEDKNIRTIVLFASFCILESISFTRKDGQYLRWDHRSGRSPGKKSFDKGKILSFKEAIDKKFDQMIKDLNGESNQDELFSSSCSANKEKPIKLLEGSCLEILPKLDSGSIDLVITSPPYCNRYDYTRTYALELMFLNCDSNRIKELRQTMLSCTVENKDKIAYLENLYSRNKNISAYKNIINVFNNQKALHEVLGILDGLSARRELNNGNIPKMVRNYFYEMCFTIFEISRLMRKGGYFVMVNDNVRYAGEEVPVDLILSDFAASFGFDIVNIWALPIGKGNSSQQMGLHGRSALRKCVYVWRKK